MAGVNIRMIRSIQQKQAKLLDLALQEPRIGPRPLPDSHDLSSRKRARKGQPSSERTGRARQNHMMSGRTSYMTMQEHMLLSGYSPPPPWAWPEMLLHFARTGGGNAKEPGLSILCGLGWTRGKDI